MPLENIDQLISASIYSSQVVTFNKLAVSPRTTFADLFFSPGLPGSASLPASTSLGGTNYDSSSIGGIQYNRTTGSNDYLSCLSYSSTREGAFFLVDHLWGCSGLAITSGSTSTISSMSNITRYNGGEGCEIAYVCLDYTGSISGSTGTKIMTVSYTNSDGVSGRTGSIIFPTLTTISTGSHPFLVFSTLQDGDKGVKSVQSIENTNVSFTTGSHGLVVLKRLLMMPVGLGSPGLRYDALKTGLINIDRNACLNFISSTTNVFSTGMLVGTINIISI